MQFVEATMKLHYPQKNILIAPEFDTLFDCVQDAELRQFILMMMVETGARISDERVKRLLHDPSQEIITFMTAYPWLNEEQLQYLVATHGKGMAIKLINRHRVYPLSAATIIAMINAKWPEYDRLLANRRFGIKLLPESVAILSQRKDLLTRFLIANRYGVGSMTVLFREMLDHDEVENMCQALTHWEPVPSEMVDLMLAKAPLEVIRQLSGNRHFSPTPSQVFAMINNLDSAVRIGLLGRKDINLSSEVVNAGVFDPDEDVSFWYFMRKEFAPTEAQIEIGLSSKRHMLRRGFALNNAIVPNPAQIERGLNDPDSIVRVAFVEKKNIVLTERQIDRCVVDVDFSVREKCVNRPEFHLTQAQFELIVSDQNPRIFSDFVTHNAKRATPQDLVPFINTTLKSGSVAALIGLAKQNTFTLDDAQMAAGLNSSDRTVRIAFESRRKLAENSEICRCS